MSLSRVTLGLVRSQPSPALPSRLSGQAPRRPTAPLGSPGRQPLRGGGGTPRHTPCCQSHAVWTFLRAAWLYRRAGRGSGGGGGEGVRGLAGGRGASYDDAWWRIRSECRWPAPARPGHALAMPHPAPPLAMQPAASYLGPVGDVAAERGAARLRGRLTRSAGGRCGCRLAGRSAVLPARAPALFSRMR